MALGDYNIGEVRLGPWAVCGAAGEWMCELAPPTAACTVGPRSRRAHSGHELTCGGSLPFHVCHGAQHGQERRLAMQAAVPCSLPAVCSASYSPSSLACPRCHAANPSLTPAPALTQVWPCRRH